MAREDCFSETGAGISVPRKQKQARQPFAELTMMPLPMHGEVDFMVHYCILILKIRMVETGTHQAMREKSGACQYPPKRSVGNNGVLILDRQAND